MVRRMIRSSRQSLRVSSSIGGKGWDEVVLLLLTLPPTCTTPQ